jgi:hypothetical protein
MFFSSMEQVLPFSWPSVQLPNRSLSRTSRPPRRSRPQSSLSSWKPKPTSISLLSLRDPDCELPLVVVWVVTAPLLWVWVLLDCVVWSVWVVCSPKPNEASWARAGRARQHNADRQVRASTAAIAASSEGWTARVSNRWGGRRCEGARRQPSEG